MITKTLDLSLWVKYLNPNDEAPLRLFCFPYAGGDTNIFFRWPKSLPGSVEICPVQLPGRGLRVHEAPYQDLASLITDLADAIFPHLVKPFALFGHSMGALIIFELTRYLRKHYALLPAHIFAGGYAAPQKAQLGRLAFTLSDRKFIKALNWLYQVPKEIVNNKELLDLMLPTVRADFKMCAGYEYIPDEPFNCPITTFSGTRDLGANRRKVKAWCEQTSSRYHHYTFSGGHFFLNSAEKSLLQRLGQELAPYL